jgi:hypothetical protein
MGRVLVTLVLIAAVLTVNAGAAPHRAHSAAKRAYTAKLTYTETDHGTAKGGGTSGIVGRGSVSAQLGPMASIAAHLMGAATGVPLVKIVKGGGYGERSDIDAKGKFTGILVVKLKSGLGTLCVRYIAKPGRFNGGSFVPMSGSVTSLGGTGKAAKWRLGAAFDQTGITGSGPELFKVRGSLHASTGPAKGFNSACKKVAKLPRG